MQSRVTEMVEMLSQLQCSGKPSLSMHLNEKKEAVLQRTAQAEGMAHTMALRCRQVWHVPGRPGQQEE